MMDDDTKKGWTLKDLADATPSWIGRGYYHSEAEYDIIERTIMAGTPSLPILYARDMEI